MDHGSTPLAGTRHLVGVAKTLRRLYAPTDDPSDAIRQALEALARRERSARTYAATADLLAPVA